jgi:DNA-binding NarL/FixJ family response regulator
MVALSRLPTTSPIRVLLGDGRALFRSGLARLLAAEPGIVVVAEASDAAGVLDAALSTGPDVVLLDPFLPGGAVGIVRALRLRRPQSEVLLYGVPEDDAIFLGALQAGVKGFADQGTDVGYLVAAIRSVAAGEVMVSPRLARHIAASYAALLTREQSGPRGASNDLTQREFDVLQLIAAGHSNRRAANALGLSEHTVRAHLRSVSRKLGVQNRVQAVAEAARLGLISGDVSFGPGASGEPG